MHTDKMLGRKIDFMSKYFSFIILNFPYEFNFRSMIIIPLKLLQNMTTVTAVLNDHFIFSKFSRTKIRSFFILLNQF